MENLQKLCNRYPSLACCRKDMKDAADLMIATFEMGNRLYICGNGGSAADADHIVGELMKGFLKKRPLNETEKQKFAAEDKALACGLMKGLPAISLHSQSSLLTAFMNDENPSLVFAQALYALGKEQDLLLAISTSGNSENVLLAAKVAKALGMKVLSLTGRQSCALDAVSDITIHADETETYRVQELHLPIYHWICATVEEHFYME